MASVYTTVGKQWVVDKMRGSVVTSQNRVGWGTGAGTAAVGDTTLFTESPDETRATATLTSPSAALYQAVGTLTVVTAGKTITNAGLFDAATVGVMMMKGDHTGIPLLIGDSIQYTFQLTQT